MGPRGVDPEKWGRPTWVVMHALAYLASTHRMDGSVVRGTFADMRLLLPCKKCRVGLAEIISERPLPETDEDLPEWVNEAHNAVNRKLGRREVAMEDGLGARIASMDVPARRAFVLVAAVRAAEYMRGCIEERGEYEQYKHELPAIYAAWARFKKVTHSMPVALRARRGHRERLCQGADDANRHSAPERSRGRHVQLSLADPVEKIWKIERKCVVRRRA
jgi:hypothetical protein